MEAPASLPEPSLLPPVPTTPLTPPLPGIPSPSLFPGNSTNDIAPALIIPDPPLPQELIPAPVPVPPPPLPPSLSPTPSWPPEESINVSPLTPSFDVYIGAGDPASIALSQGPSPSPSLPPIQILNNSNYFPPWWPPLPRILPPHHSSTSNSSPALIVGITAAATVAGLFSILGFALLLWHLCQRKKKNKTKHFEDCESFPRENFYNAEDKLLNKKMPVVGAHVIFPAAGKPFSPYFNSNGGHSSSINSESDNLFLPQARITALVLSGANFSYEDLALATDGFSPENLLGEGGFGYVHKGILSNGIMIAVKQLKEGSRQGEREFQAEVETISRVHHKHLVSLFGYCISGAKRLLVYEFVPNGTLEFHLHGKDQPVMQWETRMRIAKGAAKGLAYLHEDCNPTIIHRDIKATNILLNSKFEAKVSDFGLAKIFSDSEHHISHVSTRVVGTFGYLAPEYAESGKASDKSDVYSFGVMLLELISGQQPIIESETSMSLVTWARPLLRQAQEDQSYAGLVDPHLQGNYESEELAKMVACASACVRHSSWLRPRMSLIVRALEGDLSVSDLGDGIRPGESSISEFLNHDFGDDDVCKFQIMFANGQKSIDK